VHSNVPIQWEKQKQNDYNLDQGRHQVTLGERAAQAPSGAQGKNHGSGVKPPKTENFLAFGCTTEAANRFILRIFRKLANQVLNVTDSTPP